MKRRWLITLLLFIMVPVTAVLLHCWPRPVPLEECSEVYRRYADTDGVRATYIKDYRVNDTLTVDVTLLQATDSSGWNIMKESFGILEPETNHVNEAIDKGKDVLTLLQVNKEREGMCEKDAAVASFRDCYVCVFHMENTVQKNAMLDIIYDVIFYSLKNNKPLNQ